MRHSTRDDDRDPRRGHVSILLVSLVIGAAAYIGHPELIVIVIAALALRMF